MCGVEWVEDSKGSLKTCGSSRVAGRPEDERTWREELTSDELDFACVHEHKDAELMDEAELVVEGRFELLSRTCTR